MTRRTECEGREAVQGRQMKRDRERPGEKEREKGREMGETERDRERSSGYVKEERRRQAPFARARQAAPFAKHPLSLVRGEGGEPRRPQHDRRPHWSTRLLWVGLRKNWRGEKSPLNSCGYGCEKLESAQPASSARRIVLTLYQFVVQRCNRNRNSNQEHTMEFLR